MNMPGDFAPLPPHAGPQTTFRPLLNDLCQTLARPPFGRALRSVCPHGSVTRGEANAGRSDLDLTLVLRNLPSPELAAQLETVRLTLQARHPEVGKIGFDIGRLDQARDPTNRGNWGYWLKHRCRYLWGESLASTLPLLRPAKVIAPTLNGDCAQVLEDYARCLESAPSEEECRRLQRKATRKPIRSSDILRGGTESTQPETLEHYLALFRAQHPGQAPALEYFKAVLDGQVTDSAVFIERLRAFST